MISLAEQTEASGLILPSGLTIDETQLLSMITIVNLYKEYFSKGLPLYYQDDRSEQPEEFIRANPDGSEDLVSFDLYSRVYTLIKNLVPPGEGYWAFLSNRKE